MQLREFMTVTVSIYTHAASKTITKGIKCGVNKV